MPDSIHTPPESGKDPGPDGADAAATPVRDRAIRSLQELAAIAHDCFGAGRPDAALAAVYKAAGVRLVLSFMDDTNVPSSPPTSGEGK